MKRSFLHLYGQVLECPGEGYLFLAWDKEYEQVLRQCLTPCGHRRHTFCLGDL